MADPSAPVFWAALIAGAASRQPSAVRRTAASLRARPVGLVGRVRGTGVLPPGSWRWDPMVRVTRLTWADTGRGETSADIWGCATLPGVGKVAVNSKLANADKWGGH